MTSAPEAVQFTLLADPKMDQYAGYQRWFFEDITRPGGRRSFLMDSEAAIGRAVLRVSKTAGGSDLMLTYREGYQSAAGGY